MHIATALAFAAGLGLLAAPAEAAPRKHNYVYGRDHTLYTHRDENGHKRTRIIIQKRSYLDPGTAALPSDRRALDYVENPNQSASSILDNTAFGRNQQALPDNWTLPFWNNPYLSGWR